MARILNVHDTGEIIWTLGNDGEMRGFIVEPTGLMRELSTQEKVDQINPPHPMYDDRDD